MALKERKLRGLQMKGRRIPVSSYTFRLMMYSGVVVYWKVPFQLAKYLQDNHISDKQVQVMSVSRSGADLASDIILPRHPSGCGDHSHQSIVKSRFVA